MSNKALLYHLPKTAGRSLRYWLEKELGPNLLWFRGGNIDVSESLVTASWEGREPTTPTFEATCIGGHDASRWHAEHANWLRWKAYTILRNPPERLYSQYRHFSRKNQMPSMGFLDWASGSDRFGLCHCLWCYYGEAKDSAPRKHKRNPIAWFYASRNLKQPPDDPYEAARDTLIHTNIWLMDKVEDAVADLVEYLSLDASTYKPFDVSGSGREISKEYRIEVERLHPLDMELWKEFGRGRK